MSGLATTTIGPDDHGEIAFDACEARLDIGYSGSTTFFDWGGGDDVSMVSGDGNAEWLDTGSLEIVFSYHNGEEAILKVIRDLSADDVSWASSDEVGQL